jgi:DnaJ-class molecular chaperone
MKINSYKFCPECKGEKYQKIEHETFVDYKKCKRCKGKGIIKLL